MSLVVLGVMERGWLREAREDVYDEEVKRAGSSAKKSWCSLIFGSSPPEAFVLFLRGAFGLLSIAFGFLAIEMMPLGDAMSIVMTAPTVGGCA